MSVYFCKKTRRQFLVGSGKALLALPVLPSLLPRQAWGQLSAAPPRLMLFRIDHNNPIHLCPNPLLATQPVGPVGSKEVSIKSLGALTSHSPAMTHALYESLKSKDQLSILRGLDIRHSVAAPAHGSSWVNAGRDRKGADNGNHPSIDTVLARSKSVYPDGTPLEVRKAMRFAATTSEVTDFYDLIGNSVTPRTYYGFYRFERFHQFLFSSISSSEQENDVSLIGTKTSILNKVVGSFNSVKNSATISAQDKLVIEAHMDSLSDVERSMASTFELAAGCSIPEMEVLGIGFGFRKIQIALNLMAIALKCGISKVGVADFKSSIPVDTTGGTGLHPVMHGFDADGAINPDLYRRVGEEYWRRSYEVIANSFLSLLDEVEGETGRTFIDNMLTGVICQGGVTRPIEANSHTGIDSQQVLLGTMGGRMRGGNFLVMPRQQGVIPRERKNTPYNRFLLTLLNLMGVKPAEYSYATSNGKGIGHYDLFKNYPNSNLFYQPIDELLA